MGREGASDGRNTTPSPGSSASSVRRPAQNLSPRSQSGRDLEPNEAVSLVGVILRALSILQLANMSVGCLSEPSTPPRRPDQPQHNAARKPTREANSSTPAPLIMLDAMDFSSITGILQRLRPIIRMLDNKIHTLRPQADQQSQDREMMQLVRLGLGNRQPSLTGSPLEAISMRSLLSESHSQEQLKSRARLMLEELRKTLSNRAAERQASCLLLRVYRDRLVKLAGLGQMMEQEDFEDEVTELKELLRMYFAVWKE